MSSGFPHEGPAKVIEMSLTKPSLFKKVDALRLRESMGDDPKWFTGDVDVDCRDFLEFRHANL
jgi:hypothetical protein